MKLNPGENFFLSDSQALSLRVHLNLEKLTEEEPMNPSSKA